MTAPQKILIVHAHPEPQSFTHALCEKAVHTLESMGCEVKLSDLYAMQWNPIASKSDFLNPQNSSYMVYALEQRNAYKNHTLAKDISTELEKLMWCDLLILSFPIFWFSMPAMLKGWIDRVMISGICYGGKRFYDKGGLRGKRVLLALTLGGQEHMFGDDRVHCRLEEMLTPIMRGTLAYVGMDVLNPFVGWHVPYISQEARQKILDSYEMRLKNLHQEKPLIYPKLSDFDENLYPVQHKLKAAAV